MSNELTRTKIVWQPRRDGQPDVVAEKIRQETLTNWINIFCYICKIQSINQNSFLYGGFLIASCL